MELAAKYIDAGTLSFRMALGVDRRPPEFNRDFVRLFRKPLARILKKANRQIRETKQSLSLPLHSGILFVVNDGLPLEPQFVCALLGDILTHSYSSIDCCVYMTLNAYVQLPSSDHAHLLWVPSYSKRAPDALVAFVDSLGRKWSDLLGKEIGPWDVRVETTDPSVVRGAKLIKKGP